MRQVQGRRRTRDSRSCSRRHSKRSTPRACLPSAASALVWAHRNGVPISDVSVARMKIGAAGVSVIRHIAAARTSSERAEVSGDHHGLAGEPIYQCCRKRGSHCHQSETYRCPHADGCHPTDAVCPHRHRGGIGPVADHRAGQAQVAPDAGPDWPSRHPGTSASLAGLVLIGPSSPAGAGPVDVSPGSDTVMSPPINGLKAFDQTVEFDDRAIHGKCVPTLARSFAIASSAPQGLDIPRRSLVVNRC